jgi:hypothetical protein
VTVNDQRQRVVRWRLGVVCHLISSKQNGGGMPLLTEATWPQYRLEQVEVLFVDVHSDRLLLPVGTNRDDVLPKGGALDVDPTDHRHAHRLPPSPPAVVAHLLHEPRRLALVGAVEPERAPLVLAVEEALGLLIHLPVAARGDRALPVEPACEEVPTALFLAGAAAREHLCQRAGALSVHVRGEDGPVDGCRAVAALDPRPQVVAHALLRRRVEVDARRRRHRARWDWMSQLNRKKQSTSFFFNSH